MSLLLSKGLEDRSQSSVNGRRGSRCSTGTLGLMIMRAWRHRRWRWNPKIIIIIRIRCALSLELIQCLSLDLVLVLGPQGLDDRSQNGGERP
jgi:hypothetical protein